MDGAVDWAQELPEDCGGDVAEDGAGAAGEHRRHEASVEAQPAVADGVDAAVDAMQPSRTRSLRDSSAPQPNAFELAQSDDSVLPRSDLIDPQIERVEFVLHRETKSTGASGSPPTLRS